MSETTRKEILCLEDEIYETMDLMPAHILLNAKNLEQELQVFYQELKPEDMRSTLKDSMLISDAFRNIRLLQQMGLDNLAENFNMEEGFTSSVLVIAAVKSQFFVGLEKSIGDLRRPLFQNELSIVRVRCMGGIGKATLALALLNDAHIKGYFQNLLVTTDSESPNGKGLLETMWEGNVGRKRSEFQNLEDAHMQLEQQLLKQSKLTLLMLDDVGSRENLDRLLFQVAGYKTLFTTRDSSIIPRNHSIQFYQLPLLGQEDAQSLFCFWASGQMPIANNGDANLSKQGSSRIFWQRNGIC